MIRDCATVLLFLGSALAALAPAVCGAAETAAALTAEEIAAEKALQEKYADYRGVDEDYRHAGQAALERWRDRKFGMRIHWGVYSVLGLDASWPTLNASKEFKTIYRTLY